MTEPHDLGTLAHIAAEALGEPGQRRFRLVATGQTGDIAILWLEKEQMAALGDAIETVLTNEGYTYSPAGVGGAMPHGPVSASPGLEFRVGQLSMGVDQQRGRMVVIAGEASDDEGTSVSMEMDFGASFVLRRQVAEVVAAGRPPCPLCGGPLDPGGHICPRTNGHHSQA